MVYAISTHASLLARLSEGTDGPAWSEFNTRYRDVIRGFGLRRGLQPADAEDLLQDVFLVLSQNLKEFQYQPEKGRFRGYLKTIAVRLLIKRFGRPRSGMGQSAVEATMESAEDADADEAAWELEWRQYHLRLALEQVRLEFRGSAVRAFELLTQAQRDAHSVAEELGMSVDSVYQAKSRILKRLRTIVAEQVAAEG